MSLHPFPSTLNQDAVMVLVSAVAGKIDIETAHAGWDVGGFALSQFDPNHKPVAIAAAKAAGPCSPDECKAVLESLKDDGTAKAGKVDWGKVLQVVMTILGLFLQSTPA